MNFDHNFDHKKTTKKQLKEKDIPYMVCLNKQKLQIIDFWWELQDSNL